MSIHKPERNVSNFLLRFGSSVGFFALPLIVFTLSSFFSNGQWLIFTALFLLVTAIALYFIPGKPRGLSVSVWILLVLALIASTNWFYSPFFFALYLLAITLGFLYTPLTATAFTAALLIIFSLSFGEQDASYDFLVFLSLLSVIPITVALRRNYLIVQQEKKGILILESDQRKSGITSLDAVLENQVNKIGVTLRQPITYIKQGLHLLIKGKLTEEEADDILPRMQKSADELFTLVKEFERGATNNDLIGRNNQEGEVYPASGDDN